MDTELKNKKRSFSQSPEFRNLRKNFRIFYKSAYGKTSFYILLLFAIVALLTPILAPQPYSYIVPAIDTHSAELRFSEYLPGANSSSLTYFSPQASSPSVSGTTIITFGLSNGTIYSVGDGATSSTPIGSAYKVFTVHVNSTNKMLPPSIITLSSYYILEHQFEESLSNFLVLASSNGTVGVSQISWTGHSPGAGHPYASGNESVRLNGSIVSAPVTNAPRLESTIPTYVPFYGTNVVSSAIGGNPGKILVVTENKSSFFLSQLFAYPLSVNWTVKLPGTSPVSSPQFYGSFFSSSKGTMAIVGQGSVLYAFNSSNGALVWSHNFNSSIFNVPFFIPRSYQITDSSYNSIFVASGDSVYMVSLANGVSREILTTSSRIYTLSGTYGSSGFPTVLMTETAHNLYVTTQNLTSDKFNSFSYKLPKTAGSFIFTPAYDHSSSTFVILSTRGLFISVSASTSNVSDPFTWSAQITPTPSNVTAPLFFLDTTTGREEFGTITQDGHLVVYDVLYKNDNPIPPTFNTRSGLWLPLGTNPSGNDVFSQFIQSFASDWELGLAIGLFTIFIAVLVAMLVGFLTNFVSKFLETVSLAIYLIPGLALLIAMASILGESFGNLILIVTVIGWPFTTFTLIGVVRQVKSRTFVEASKLFGSSTTSILRRHILPNIAPLLVYLLALSISGAIGGVSTLQFLGIAPTTVNTWGGMLSGLDGDFFEGVLAPWWVIPPIVALTVFILAFIFVSRGLDEVVNPRLRRR